MYKFERVVILFFICKVAFAEQDCNADPTLMTETQLLKEYLLCDYDRTVRPVVHHTNQITVSVTMLLRSIIFDEHINSIDIQCWMFWTWNDEHLRWNPSDYDGVSVLNVNSDEIWVPEIAQFASTATWEVEVRMPSGRCEVKPNGDVMCAPGTIYFAQCTPDSTYWPFDKANCSLRLGAWMQSGGEINVTIGQDSVDLFNYKPSRQWNLLSATARRHQEEYTNNRTFPWIHYSFVMQRHSNVYEATVVIPALLFAVLVLTMSWLSYEGANRLNLSCAILLLHYIQLQYVGWMLHSNGDKCPLIVLFYRDSMALTAISLLVTIVLRYLASTTMTPPTWVSRTSKWVLGTRFGTICLLLHVKMLPEDTATLKQEGSKEESGLVQLSSMDEPSDWSLFCTLLDRICFIVYLLVYTFIFVRCSI